MKNNLIVKQAKEKCHEIQHTGPSGREVPRSEGKIKEIAGELSDNPGLEAEGSDEKVAGKVQKKIGQIKKVLGK